MLPPSPPKKYARTSVGRLRDMTTRCGGRVCIIHTGVYSKKMDSGRIIRPDSKARHVGKRIYPSEYMCVASDGTVLSAPRGIAYDASTDEFITSDSQKNRLSVFAYAGPRFLRYLGESAGLDRPQGVALMPPASVLVADYGNDRVVVLSRKDGSLTASFRCEVWPRSVAFDPITNHIFVTGNHRVSVFDASTFARVAYLGPHHIDSPKQILVDDIGQIAVSDGMEEYDDPNMTHVHVFSKDLSYVRLIRYWDEHHICIALDRDGDLVVG